VGDLVEVVGASVLLLSSLDLFNSFSCCSSFWE
jgi:hypothetical protein